MRLGSAQSLRRPRATAQRLEFMQVFDQVMCCAKGDFTLAIGISCGFSINCECDYVAETRGSGETAVLLLQETRGTDGDVMQLPDLRAGGVIFGFLGRCVLVISMLLDSWMDFEIFMWIHRGRSATRGELRRSSDPRLADAKALVLLGGDRTFIAGGDTRQRPDERTTREDPMLSNVFDDAFQLRCETHQQEPACRRLPLAVGGSAACSGIDRFHSNMHVSPLSMIAAVKGVRGAFVERSAPSGHRAMFCSRAWKQ